MSLRAWWREVTGIARVDRAMGLLEAEREDYKSALIHMHEAYEATRCQLAEMGRTAEELRAGLPATKSDETAAAIRELVAVLSAVPDPPAPVADPPKNPCTCGSVTFTAGGQAVSAHADSRLRPAGGVISCLACGRRWALAEGRLIEPHQKAMPPAWTAQDLHELVQESQLGTPRSAADLLRLRAASRRPSDGLRKAPRG